MKSLNQVQLIGNLGADPELKYTQSGTAVVTLSLCTNEKFKNKQGDKVERPTWHRIILWERLAEIASEYLGKGDALFISGKISNRSYEDKEGKTVYISEIIARELIMLGAPKDAQPKRQAPARGSKPAPDDPTQITDEDIPF